MDRHKSFTNAKEPFMLQQRVEDLILYSRAGLPTAKFRTEANDIDSGGIIVGAIEHERTTHETTVPTTTSYWITFSACIHIDIDCKSFYIL
jgi:hypothetical protein